MLGIVEIAGFQYKVEKDMVFKVPTIDAEVGSKVTFDKVLLKSEDGKIELGKPTVAGASVEVEILEHNRYKKVINFIYRRRKDSAKKKGHRQAYTVIKVLEIK